MTRYLSQPRNWKFAKGYGSLSFRKNIGKTYLKYSQKLLGNAKESATDTFKSASEKVTNEDDKEIPKERYMSAEERQNHWWSEINITI